MQTSRRTRRDTYQLSSDHEPAATSRTNPTSTTRASTTSNTVTHCRAERFNTRLFNTQRSAVGLLSVIMFTISLTGCSQPDSITVASAHHPPLPQPPAPISPAKLTTSQEPHEASTSPKPDTFQSEMSQSGMSQSGAPSFGTSKVDTGQSRAGHAAKMKELLSHVGPNTNTPFRDLLMGRETDQILIGDAVDRLIVKCMSQAQQKYEVSTVTSLDRYPYRPFGTQPGDIDTPSLDDGGVERQHSQEWMNAFHGTATSPGCASSSHQTLFGPPKSQKKLKAEYTRLNRYTYQAAHSVRQSPAYQSALSHWQECMKPSGSKAADPSQLHPKHHRLDLKCKEESNLLKIALPMLKQRELELLTTHADALSQFHHTHLTEVAKAKHILGR